MTDEIEASNATDARGARPVPDDDTLNDQADAAEDFLNGLLDVLDMDGEAEAEIEGSGIVVEMAGPNMGLLIGRHGLTLDALQDLTRAVVLRVTGSFALLTLDIEGYRERHREILSRRARTAASTVLSSGVPQSLEAMSAQDRKIVHTALAEFAGVKTTSEGEDPERHVVILPD